MHPSPGTRYGLTAPPAAPIRRLNGLLRIAMAKESIRRCVEENGMEVSATLLEALARFQRDALNRWGWIIKTAGIVPA